MAVGPSVFGRGRQELWVASNANLKDKLAHYLPRLRNALPHLTDIFLPVEASINHKDQVRQNRFFCHTYAVANDQAPAALAKQALDARRRQGTGALEFDIEGGAVTDGTMRSYIEQLMQAVRKNHPNLPVRLNVVPYKGQFLPADLINNDPKLYLVVQSYGGNMDILFPADEVKQEVVYYGVNPDKVSVMHAVMCAPKPGMPRQITIPAVRDKGAFYIDDLLLDAGLL